jgi:membrane protease YdiL (CAAX protease family)
MTGVHGFHVFSGVLFLTIIMLNAMSGLYVSRKNGYEMVEKIGLYWHFVDLVWVFVFLVFYLLYRSGESAATIGLDASQPMRDLVRGLILAAVIGGIGLALYITAYRFGASVQIQAAALTDQWWRLPVLLLSAAQNSLLEEVVVLAYLLHRLRQLGWATAPAIGASAMLRGAYHLYQGFGGFIGNLGMGVVFGWLYYRWQRVMPFVIAHFLIDAVAFIGYSALHGKVAWIP